MHWNDINALKVLWSHFLFVCKNMKCSGCACNWNVDRRITYDESRSVPWKNGSCTQGITKCNNSNHLICVL